MSFLDKFRRKTVSAQTLRLLDLAAGGGDGALTHKAAQAVPAVFAAVRVISEDIAKLSAKLKVVGGGVGDIAVKEPENGILTAIAKPLSEVDDGYTAMEMIEYIVASAALTGVGVGHQNIVGGITREITPIRRGAWRQQGKTWELLDAKNHWQPVNRSDLFVLRGPDLGADITSLASRAIKLAVALDKTMASLARKGGRAQGLLTMEPMRSGSDKAAAFVKEFKETFGADSDGGIMAIDMGKMDQVRLSLTPEELQIVAAQKGAIEQIARAFRVQPARIMHEMGGQTYASAYQWNIAHVNDTIQPWAKRFKQSFSKDVLRGRASKFYVDMNMKSLLAGAPGERAQFHMAMRQMGAISPYDVAKIEDLPTQGVSKDPAYPLLTNPQPDYTGPKP